MDFIELAKKRYSVRAYKSTPVEYHKLQIVLDAARLAPTAANRQPFQIIIIQTQDRQEELLRIYNKPWFVEAPLIICICGVPFASWTRKDGKIYCDVDVSRIRVVSSVIRHKGEAVGSVEIRSRRIGQLGGIPAQRAMARTGFHRESERIAIEI